MKRRPLFVPSGKMNRTMRCLTCGRLIEVRGLAMHGLKHVTEGTAIATLSSSATYDFHLAPFVVPRRVARKVTR